jgi:hypothetical protein
MNSSGQISTVEGTCTLILTFPWPWPPSSPILFHVMPLENGLLNVSMETSGCLRAQLIGAGHGAEVISCPLRIPGPDTMSQLWVFWKYPNIDLFIRMSLIGSIERQREVPSAFAIIGGIPNPNLYDFSKENARAIQKRQGRFGGSHPKPGRKRGDTAFIFGALSTELLQLRDLLNLVEQGGAHHAAGLSNQLRKLIAIGDPMPLLQLCAAVINTPLLVYAGPRDGFPRRSLKPTQGWLVIATAEPSPLTKNPIDLDVWLDLDAISVANQTINNRALLRTIGNTVGSHFDIDVHPSVTMLRDSGATSNGQQTDLFLQYLRHVSRMIIGLSERVLSGIQLGTLAAAAVLPICGVVADKFDSPTDPLRQRSKIERREVAFTQGRGRFGPKTPG